MTDGIKVIPATLAALVISADRTSLQGYVDASYSQLIELFGNPCESDGDKVDAEWCLFIDGILVTIYNYKNGRNYLGPDGLDVEEMNSWNIGGKFNSCGQEWAVASLSRLLPRKCRVSR